MVEDGKSIGHICKAAEPVHQVEDPILEEVLMRTIGDYTGPESWELFELALNSTPVPRNWGPVAPLMEEELVDDVPVGVDSRVQVGSVVYYTPVDREPRWLMPDGDGGYKQIPSEHILIDNT